MEGDRVKLIVMGLSYNPIRDGAYALMLAQVNGPYRIPVVIGAAEAQSIAVVIENVVTPRPLTHDLFTRLGHYFGISLIEVFINGFEDGIFSSTMIFEGLGGEIVTIDSRTSDAIAIALRMNAPIYTTREILEETGFILEKKGPGTGKATGHSSSGLRVEIEWSEDGSNEIENETEVHEPTTGDVAYMSLAELELKLLEAVEAEDYEKAGELKKMIEIIKSNTDNI